MTELVQIKGLNELSRALKALPQEIANKHLNSAVSAASALVKEQARQYAPVYHGKVADGHPPPGTLKGAIFIKRIRGLPWQRSVYVVFVRSGKRYQAFGKKQRNVDAFYWKWVEFGTSKMAAHPFLRPAFENRKGEALNILVENLRTGLGEAAKTVAWSNPA